MEKLGIEEKDKKKKFNWVPVAALTGITGAGVLGLGFLNSNKTPVIGGTSPEGGPTPPEVVPPKPVEDLTDWIDGIEFTTHDNFKFGEQEIATQEGTVFESQRQAFVDAQTALSKLDQYDFLQKPDTLKIAPIKQILIQDPFDGNINRGFTAFVTNESRINGENKINIATQYVNGELIPNDDITYQLVHESVHTSFPYKKDIDLKAAVGILIPGNTVTNGSYVLFNQDNHKYYNNLFEEISADLLTAKLVDENDSLEWGELNTKSEYTKYILGMSNQIETRYGIEIDPDDFAEILSQSMVVEDRQVFEEFGNLMKETYGINDEAVEELTIDYIKSQSDMNFEFE